VIRDGHRGFDRDGEGDGSSVVNHLTLARALAVALLVLVTLPRTAMSSPAEWSPSRWCDRHLIARLLEGTIKPNRTKTPSTNLCFQATR
jgi:hypothetical protein